MRSFIHAAFIMSTAIHAAGANPSKVVDACKIPEPKDADQEYTIDARNVGVQIEDKAPHARRVAVVIINKNPFRFRYSTVINSRPLAAAQVLDFLKSQGVSDGQWTTMSSTNTEDDAKILSELTAAEEQLKKAKIAHKRFQDVTDSPDAPCETLHEAGTKFLDDAKLPDITRLKQAISKHKSAAAEQRFQSIEKDTVQIQQARTFVEGILNASSAFHEIRYISRQGQPSLVTLTLSRSDLRVEKPTVENVSTLSVAIGSVPLSVSVGIGFSTVDEIIIRRQAASDEQGGVTTVFGYESDSRIKPSGVAMLTGHIKSLKTWTLGASAGFVLSSRGDKSEIEYILGPSFGFKDELIWLTAGMHVARVQKLAGGFSIGDKVPLSLQDPLPLQRNYRPGVIFSLTFKIR